MASWVYPVANAITGTTKIKEADNKIQAGLDDLQAWINNEAPYVGSGLQTDVTDTITVLFASFVDNTVATEW